MIYDINVLSILAKEYGVIRDTLEKVIRLSELLRFINTDSFLKDKLALKGGTAINLLYTNLPRLSVDIDLDYAINHDKDTMLKFRKNIKKTLETHLASNGYTILKKTRSSHSLDSFVASYTSSGGGRDNIKIDINYSMRCHILPLESTQCSIKFIEQFSVLTVSKIEIYAGKINALLSRTQIRDLYDVYQMKQNNLLNEQEILLLQNILLFYRYIQSDSLIVNFSSVENHSKRTYLQNLLPVLRKNDPFDLELAKKTVLELIIELTTYNQNQLKFIESINSKNPAFYLLFENDEMIQNAYNHPMTLWKIMHINKMEIR